MNEPDPRPELSDDDVIARMRNALDEVHAVDPALQMPVTSAADRPSAGRWFAVAAAALLVAVGVGAILVNRGKSDPITADSLAATTTTAPPETAPGVNVTDPNWYVLQLPGFTAEPEHAEACCPPMPAPGPATVMAWGDVNGLDHGVLLLTITPKMEGEPQLDWQWLMMTDERANTLIGEAVPGSGLPYVLPSQSMRLIGNGLANIGNLRGQVWSNREGSVDISVADYRGQLDLLATGDVEATTVAGQPALRVHRSGGDFSVWQTPDGRWATVAIDDRGLADREDEVFAAIVQAPLVPTTSTPTTTVATTSPPTIGSTSPPPAADTVLSGIANVIDSGDGPMLATAFRTSLPPQGGDVPIDGFDWTMVDDELTAGGVTWTESGYLLTGTWDGTAFHLVKPPERYVPIKGGPAPNFFPTPNCSEDDLRPISDAFAKLDPLRLHVKGWAAITNGGECLGEVTALFDTPEVRAAFEPLGAKVRVVSVFNPVDR